MSILTFYQQISFARTRSDAVVKKLDPASFDAHKKRRDEHKSESASQSCTSMADPFWHRGDKVHQPHKGKVPPKAVGGGE